MFSPNFWWDGIGETAPIIPPPDDASSFATISKNKTFADVSSSRTFATVIRTVKSKADYK